MGQKLAGEEAVSTEAGVCPLWVPPVVLPLQLSSVKALLAIVRTVISTKQVLHHHPPSSCYNITHLAGVTPSPT
jgi:hypothetical protein